MFLPTDLKPVQLFQGAANAVACDIVCCKNVQKLWFLVYHTGAADTDLVLTLREATNVAGTTNAAITTTCPIWANLDTTATDTLVRQTDAYAWTVNTGDAPNQLVVIEWDPAKHTVGYDCVYLADADGNASNTVTILAMAEMRYASETPPSVITD